MATLFRSLGFRAGVVSALILLLVLAIWYAATAPTVAAGGGASVHDSERLHVRGLERMQVRYILLGYVGLVVIGGLRV